MLDIYNINEDLQWCFVQLGDRTDPCAAACDTLSDKITAAQTRRCGEEHYASVADIDKNRIVNSFDRFLFIQNHSLLWCAQKLLNASNPCN